MKFFNIAFWGIRNLKFFIEPTPPTVVCHNFFLICFSPVYCLEAKGGGNYLLPNNSVNNICLDQYYGNFAKKFGESCSFLCKTLTSGEEASCVICQDNY